MQVQGAQLEAKLSQSELFCGSLHSELEQQAIAFASLAQRIVSQHPFVNVEEPKSDSGGGGGGGNGARSYGGGDHREAASSAARSVKHDSNVAALRTGLEGLS
jgi:hypothetical protein